MRQRGRTTVEASAVVDAPVDAVWTAWTTKSGLESFLGPHAVVVLAPLAPFEVFDADVPGLGGGERNVVLGFEPESMLHVTWRPPPDLRSISEIRTSVVVRLAVRDGDRTHVSVTESGFGEGDVWAVARESARERWRGAVLPRLVHRFDHGPLDWDDLPPGLRE